MSDLMTCHEHPKTREKLPMRWKDQDGIVHAVEGSYVHPEILLLWTRCGQKDIPAGQAYISQPTIPIDCIACQQKEADK